MMYARNAASLGFRLVSKITLLACVFICSLSSITFAQQSATPKRVLVLYWYDKDFPPQVTWDQSFQTTLQSAHSLKIEYYPEYLEANRFRGEEFYPLLHDYLRQKYADRTIDVVVANSGASLDFLLKYRADLFSNSPIVFYAPIPPAKEMLAVSPGLTGIISLNSYRNTIDLALRLHPQTEQVFFISGSLEHDRQFEARAREELRDYEGRVQINYLTDLSPSELIGRVKTLPERSIVLYAWQQSRNEQGKVLESSDMLALVSASASVPIYGMYASYVGRGVLGGYVYTTEAAATSVGQVVLRIANGEQAQDIPVESAPTVAMVDWRELQRWGISEEKLPTGTIVRFKESTVWQRYKWRIIGVSALILLQTLLIIVLLVERTRRRTTTARLLATQEQFAKAFRVNPQPMSLTTLVGGRYIDVNDSFLRMSGYARDEIVGRTTIELNLWESPERRVEFVKLIETKGWLRNIETKFRTRDGSFRVLLSSFELMPIDAQPCILTASSDITERTQAEERFRLFFELPLAGMAITSPERFLLVNHTLSTMLGYSADELVSKTWPEITHPEDIAENQRLLEQTLKSETDGYSMDKRFLHRDGRVIYASISTRCVRRADGTVDHLFLIVQDITERKQAEDWLSELTARLLKSQDEERRRIAEELHDVTAQGIGVILLNLAYLKKAIPQIDSRGKDKLAECVALGEEALREIRTLSYVLHPPLLDQAGLVTALQWYAKGFSERSGIKVDFTEDGTDGRRMPFEVENSLFRVVQECLTNIRRHTTSASASITLAGRNGSVVLQVRDQGNGLRLDVPANGVGIESLGVGIPGMRHRLKQLGGELAIDSAANGTTVTATVPVTWVNHDSHNIG